MNYINLMPRYFLKNEPRMATRIFRVVIILAGAFISACNMSPEDRNPTPGPTIDGFEFFPAQSIKEWKYRNAEEPVEERIAYIDKDGREILYQP